MHQSHPLASRATLHVSQLRHESVILLNSSFQIHQDFLAQCRAAGFVPDVRLEAAEIALVHRMAEKGAGIGITVGVVYQDYKKPDVRIIPFSNPGLSWAIYVSAKKNPSYAASRFIGHVLSAMAPAQVSS